MKKNIRFIGLDVHAETIAVAVAEGNGETRSLGVIPNRPEAVRRLVKKLGPAESLQACYEAGPCGYVLYWQLSEMAVHCDVVAPTLVPVKSGDRIKTDRRDALKPCAAEGSVPSRRALLGAGREEAGGGRGDRSSLIRPFVFEVFLTVTRHRRRCNRKIRLARGG